MTADDADERGYETKESIGRYPRSSASSVVISRGGNGSSSTGCGARISSGDSKKISRKGAKTRKEWVVPPSAWHPGYTLCDFAPSKELVAYREQMSIVEFFNITTGQSP